MNKTNLVCGLAVLVALAACGQRSEPAATPADSKINAGATVPGATTGRPAGQADAEDPKTQTNSGRPDAPEDLKPGTDGNPNLPAR